MAKRPREVSEEILAEEVTKKTEESPAKEEAPRSQRIRTGVIVGNPYVSVRKEASLESDRLEVMREGDKVAIIGEKQDFYKVKTSVNPVGYISSEFLKEE